METIEIYGGAGKIVYTPSDISPKEIKKIEKKLRKLVSCPKGYITADEMIAILKKRDPLIGTLGGTLKGYRAREELTQQMLAKKAGIKQSHLSEIERNKRPIGVKVAKKLAKALNCDYRRLL